MLGIVDRREAQQQGQETARQDIAREEDNSHRRAHAPFARLNIRVVNGMVDIASLVHADEGRKVVGRPTPNTNTNNNNNNRPAAPPPAPAQNPQPPEPAQQPRRPHQQQQAPRAGGAGGRGGAGGGNAATVPRASDERDIPPNAFLLVHDHKADLPRAAAAFRRAQQQQLLNAAGSDSGDGDNSNNNDDDNERANRATTLVCKQCGQWCEDVRAFLRHKARKTCTRGTKWCQWPGCPKVFKHSHQLLYHVRVHTRERPYACSECPSAFAQPGDLDRHRRTHTGEKPFVCRVCGDAFTVSATLHRHMRTHSGEKPHACGVAHCKRSFVHKHDLDRHQLIAHLAHNNDHDHHGHHDHHDSHGHGAAQNTGQPQERPNA